MGMIPVFAVYSSFLQRSYDQLIHDLAICNTHAVLGVDRAGVVGDDGETHQGIFDVSFLTSVPNTTVYSPSCYEELRLCLRKAVLEDSGIVAVRYPRGNDKSNYNKSDVNTSYKYHDNGNGVLIVTYGRLYNNVLSACEILKNRHIECDTLKLVKIFPIEEEIIDIISSYKLVFFFEEAYYHGSISEKYAAVCSNIAPVAIDYFVKHGNVPDLLDELNLSPEKMADQIEDFLSYEQ